MDEFKRQLIILAGTFIVFLIIATIVLRFVHGCFTGPYQ